MPVNPPSQPSGLSPQGFPLASTLALSWSQVANATYYQWEISGTGLQSAVTSTYWPGNTTTSLNLTPVGSYLWQVRACNSAGCSSYALASFATPPPTLPSSPTGLTPGATIQNNAQTLTGTDVSLQWSSVVGVNFYNIKLVNVTTGQAIHNPVAVNASNSYFNAQNLAAGLYYWEIAACIDTTTCSVFTNAVYFRLQNSVSSPVISVTSLSQTVFDLRGQNYGSPSGNAYIPTLAIYGSALDTANQITWSWSGATSGSAIWTKSVSGSWANASGAARTVSLLSSSQINASPALIAVGDTWRGTVNWSVQVCSGTNSCSSANFSVLR